MFRALAVAATARGRPPTPGTLHRIRATLRAAFTAAVREGLRSDNPARHVELPGPRRPHAEVYTSVLPELLADAAEATARLVLVRAAQKPGRRPRNTVRSGPPKSATPALTRQLAPRRTKRSHRQRGRKKASHMRPTHVPQRSRPYSHTAIRPGQYGCAARDSNPEPAD
jgi:hypothetical protein